MKTIFRQLLWKQKQRSLGRCAVCAKKSSNYHCRSCAKKRRKTDCIWREKRRKKGICIRCGKKSDEYLCQICKKKESERVQTRRKLGLCKYCKSPSNGRIICDKCAYKQGIKVRYPLKEKWKCVDWSHPLYQIAKEFGVTIRAVRYQQKKFQNNCQSSKNK
jgi:hypothetical protein